MYIYVERMRNPHVKNLFVLTLECQPQPEFRPFCCLWISTSISVCLVVFFFIFVLGVRLCFFLVFHRLHCLNTRARPTSVWVFWHQGVYIAPEISLPYFPYSPSIPSCESPFHRPLGSFSSCRKSLFRFFYVVAHFFMIFSFSLPPSHPITQTPKNISYVLPHIYIWGDQEVVAPCCHALYI